MRKYLLILLACLVAAAAAAYSYRQWVATGGETPYRLGKVERGNITATVSATGTIAPITTVIVGESQAVALSVVFSSLVGVFFGWWPAQRASRLDPIEALRHS
jgi:ABC-type antimicrobial peptide transport system permease subunit